MFPALGEPESNEVAEEVFVEDWQFMAVAWLQGDDGGVDGWAWVERVWRYVAHDGRLPSDLQAHGQLAVVTRARRGGHAFTDFFLQHEYGVAHGGRRGQPFGHDGGADRVRQVSQHFERSVLEKRP